MTTPAPQLDAEKARQQVIVGVMLVMGTCVLGGVTAVVLVAVGMRSTAIVVAAIAVVVVFFGGFIQFAGMRKVRELARLQEKPK